MCVCAGRVNVRVLLLVAAFGNLCFMCVSKTLISDIPVIEHQAWQCMHFRVVLFVAAFGDMCCMCVWTVCVNVRVVILIAAFGNLCFMCVSKSLQYNLPFPYKSCYFTRIDI